MNVPHVPLENSLHLRVYRFTRLKKRCAEVTMIWANTNVFCPLHPCTQIHRHPRQPAPVVQGSVSSKTPPSRETAFFILRKLCKNRHKILFQGRDIDQDNRPDLISIDRKIVMNEDIAESDDLAPGDLVIVPLRFL